MPTPFLYPIFLDLRARPVLIVGGGAVAHRKATGLLEAHAAVTVISPHFAESFAALPAIERITTVYASAWMTRNHWTLVFAATNLPEVNQQVQSDAADAAILCCRCDGHDDADFLGAAGTTIAGVTLAITTGGASPALAGRIRDQATAAIDPILAQLAELLGQWRPRVKADITDAALRRKFLLQLAGPEMENRLRRHGPDAATTLFHQWLAEMTAPLASPAAPATAPANPDPGLPRPVNHAP